MKKRQLSIRRAILLGATLGLPLSATAQTSGSWIGGNGSWSVAADWSSNPNYPDVRGIAAFNNPLATTTTLDTNVSLSGMNFSGLAWHVVNANSGDTISLTGSASVNVDPLCAPDPQGLSAEDAFLRALSGTAGLTKSGNGAVLLRGTNTYSGGTTVTGGLLAVQGDASMGNASGSLVLDGGSLEFAIPSSGNPNFFRQMQLNSGGGTLMVGAFVTGTAPTWFGAITGAGTLTIDNSGNSLGESTSEVVLQASNSYTGATVIKRGTLAITGAAGSILQTSSITADCATLSLINSTGSINFNRIPDDKNVTLINGGSLYETPVTGGNEVFGGLTVDRGLNSAGGNLQINNGITRSDVGALWLTTNVRSEQPIAMIGTGAVGTPSVGVIPWIVSSQGALYPQVVTLDGDLVRPLSAPEYSSAFTPGTNVLASTSTVNAPVTINSLTLAGSVTGTGTITVSSGVITASQSLTALSCPINFGATEGVIDGGLINGPISGSNGVTINAGTLDGISTYTGTTTVNGRLVFISNVTAGTPGPLGVDTSPVVLADGTLGLGGSSSVTFARSIIAEGKQASIWGGAVPVNVSGAITVQNALDVINPNSAASALMLSGPISGPGNLVTQNVTLSGNSDFTGGVEASGSLTLGSDTCLGIGTFWINSTAISTTGIRQIANPVSILTDVTFNAASPITFTGTVSSFGGLVSVNGATVSFLGPITGGASLTKTGTGVLRVSPISQASISANAGTLQIIGGPSAASKTLALSFNGSGDIDMTNSALVVDYTGSTPASQIQTWLKNGYATGAWTGTGLNSSTAAAVAADPTNLHKTALGFDEASQLGITSFGGQSMDSTSILIRYTLSGDANLDGTVNALDFNALATHFGGENPGWFSGDFNYDGSVDSSDFDALAANYGQTMPTMAAPLGALVPEPGTVALLAIGPISLMRKRKASGS